MKLYFSRGACSLAVRIIVHEIGIPIDYEAVDLKTKQTRHGLDFLQINPKGAVPAILLDDGHILTENAVILQFLAEKYKAIELLPPAGRFDRYRVLEWLNFDSTELHKAFLPLLNPKLPPGIKEEVFKPNLEKKLAHVNQYLQESTYLAGINFTIADAYLFSMLRWLERVGLQLEGWQNLQRYFTELKERPSVQEALDEEIIA